MSGDNVGNVPLADRISLTSLGEFDKDLYGDVDKDKFLTSLPTEGEDEDDDEAGNATHPSSRSRINPTRAFLDENLQGGDATDSTSQYREQFGSGLVNTRISDRESEVDLLSKIITIIIIYIFSIKPGE